MKHLRAHTRTTHGRTYIPTLLDFTSMWFLAVTQCWQITFLSSRFAVLIKNCYRKCFKFILGFRRWILYVTLQAGSTALLSPSWWDMYESTHATLHAHKDVRAMYSYIVMHNPTTSWATPTCKWASLLFIPLAVLCFRVWHLTSRCSPFLSESSRRESTARPCTSSIVACADSWYVHTRAWIATKVGRCATKYV